MMTYIIIILAILIAVGIIFWLKDRPGDSPQYQEGGYD